MCDFEQDEEDDLLGNFFRNIERIAIAHSLAPGTDGHTNDLPEANKYFVDIAM